MAAARDGETSAPRLYLMADLDTGPAFADCLRPAVEAGDIAAVLLRSRAGALIDPEFIKTIAPIVQEHGAALLLDGGVDIVVRVGADGAHLTGIDALQAALPRLKPGRIAGAGGLSTRHDAMLAAEAGGDYVMFGDPDPAGLRPAFETVLERVSWWAEVFEIPCVGWAQSLEEVAALAKSGADFIALGAFVFADAAGPAAVVRAASRLLVRETT
jgi:thiamine-phosphate pyrophosphorylase